MSNINGQKIAFRIADNEEVKTDSKDEAKICPRGAQVLRPQEETKIHPKEDVLLSSTSVFPGRKELPSMRKHIASPALVPAGSLEWIKEKKQRDQKLTGCPAHLWLIHGNLYDLRKWMSSHPGGKQWLQWTQGTDCTVHFETHHINMGRARKVLKKFLVGPAPRPGAASAYAWGDDDLYSTLREAVHKVVKAKGGSNATPLMYALCTAGVLGWLASFVALCRYRTFKWAAVSGYFSFVMFGIGHNFFHQRNSWWRFCTDVTCFGSHDWRVSHAQSHHLYPNLDMDLEASALEPLVSFMRNRPTNHPLVYAYWHLLNFFIPITQLGDAWRRILTRSSPLLPENLLAPAQVP